MSSFFAWSNAAVSLCLGELFRTLYLVHNQRTCFLCFKRCNFFYVVHDLNSNPTNILIRWQLQTNSKNWIWSWNGVNSEDKSIKTPTFMTACRRRTKWLVHHWHGVFLELWKTRLDLGWSWVFILLNNIIYWCGAGTSCTELTHYVHHRHGVFNYRNNSSFNYPHNYSSSCWSFDGVALRVEKKPENQTSDSQLHSIPTPFQIFVGKAKLEGTRKTECYVLQCCQTKLWPYTLDWSNSDLSEQDALRIFEMAIRLRA